ncbi:hypothetical protein GCM10008938_29130 [Deinococcus roseus]|uniref:DUF503 domain-containing protein n=2 Tax=Deinococcus roseus TaxID=392414 RepID=A0ABQ2D1C6_9DEIO|nr:hypothetical protein GCM10008938_29130 [Deinococcus roseus]
MLGYIGTYICRLETPWVKSLKEKRALIKPVTEKLKARYPVTVARLDGLDAHDWEVIGVVTISNDHQWVQDTLKMVSDVMHTSGCEVTEESSSIQAIDQDGSDDEEDE